MGWNKRNRWNNDKNWKGNRKWNKNKIAVAVGLLLILFTVSAAAFSHFFSKGGRGGSVITVLHDAGNSSLEETFCEGYLQRDERWADDRMGDSPDTMAKSGCLTCCVAASLTAQGEADRTPGEWNRYFSENGVYNENGAILWGRLVEVLTDVTVNLENDMDAGSVCAALENGQYPIVKVKRKSGAYHWVMLLWADKEKEVVYCLDPIDGYVNLQQYDNRIYAVRIVTVTDGH